MYRTSFINNLYISYWGDFMKLLPVSFVFLATLIVIAISLSLTPSKSDKEPEVLIENHTENRYISYQSLESKDLENEDLELFLALKENIRMSNQVINELDFLLLEYATTDSLEGAMEAMEIAYEENVALLRDIQTRFDPHDLTLLDLKENYKKIMSHYIEGLSNQLTAIENGDINQMNSGLEATKKAKRELTLLSAVFEKE
jgi:ABC-type phosphate transport system auxiliary subunit